MPVKLSPEECMVLTILKTKGQSNAQIARTLGVSEGTIRYRLRRQAQPDGDRRRDKSHRADPLAPAIDHFIRVGRPSHADGRATRPINVRALHDYLVAEHRYEGSYRSELRFVRARYPAPQLRPFRRVETPPGAQAQVDWGELGGIDLGGGPRTLYAFVMVLSHSRKEVLIWSERMDQLAWHHAHNEAFRRLGASRRCCGSTTSGPASRGAGPWGRINPAYRCYARYVGFHVDACLPRCPEDKGKVESKVGRPCRANPMPSWTAGRCGGPARPPAGASRIAGRRSSPCCGRCRRCRRSSMWP